MRHAVPVDGHAERPLSTRPERIRGLILSRSRVALPALGASSGFPRLRARPSASRIGWCYRRDRTQ